MPCPYCNSDDCTQTERFATAKAARTASLAESIAALGNAGKAERERLNVSDFLLNLGVPFVDTDIVSVPEGQDPPDVRFDGAQFEIKELYDDGRRRMDEYRTQLREAESATRCGELRPTRPFSPVDTTLADVMALAIIVGAAHAQRYDQALVPTLDLLLYHNLVDVIGMADVPFPDTAQLAQQRWRSVSVLFGHRSIVFCAAAGAPPWLRAAAGRVAHRP
jgi:hypothetical protein